VRSFRLGRLDRAALEQGFRELRDYVGRCQFRDCSHAHEPGCAIRDAVEAGKIHPGRLANFLHMADALAPRY
jgi:ribosome biogenesis GTPase